eukprot:m51a1_g12261 hypothetical protein (496) ;mRNA; r:180740-183242
MADENSPFLYDLVTLARGRESHRYPLRPFVYRIGSSRRCDVVFRVRGTAQGIPGVHPLHALLFVDDNAVHVMSLSGRTPVVVQLAADAGRTAAAAIAARTEVVVLPEHVVKIGAVRFRVVPHDSRVESQAPTDSPALPSLSLSLAADPASALPDALARLSVSPVAPARREESSKLSPPKPEPKPPSPIAPAAAPAEQLAAAASAPAAPAAAAAAEPALESAETPSNSQQGEQQAMPATPMEASSAPRRRSERARRPSGDRQPREDESGAGPKKTREEVEPSQEPEPKRRRSEMPAGDREAITRFFREAQLSGMFGVFVHADWEGKESWCKRYRKEIEEPMCLEWMEDKFNRDKYENARQFRYDIDLIVNNTKMFYEQDESSDEIDLAEKLRRLYRRCTGSLDSSKGSDDDTEGQNTAEEEAKPPQSEEQHTPSPTRRKRKELAQILAEGTKWINRGRPRTGRVDLGQDSQLETRSPTSPERFRPLDWHSAHKRKR